MAVELATAYVSIVASTGELKKSILSELGGIDDTAKKSGAGIGSSLMKGIGGAALGGAAVVAAGAVATLGVALTKGFARLNSIDQATAKMEGLGFAAQDVEGLMSNALDSVKGTAFGLGDAATVAAQLAATGIGPGEEMAATLKTIANTAAAAGGSMDEVGSIFAKVASSGKAQNDSLQQLSDRGIPIYQALADQLGVTTDEVFNLASAGDISFAQFAAAAQAAGGDVAAAMGGTVQGSFQNLQASLGRIGAGLLGGVFDELAPTIQSITGALGPLEAVAADLGAKFGEFLVPVLESFQGLLSGGFDFSPFLEFASYLSPIGLAFKVLQPILPQVMEAFGQIAAVLGGALGQVLQVLVPIIGQLVLMLSEGLAQIIPILLPIITSLAQIIGQVLTAVLPLLAPLMQLVQAIFPILMVVIQALLPIIQGLVDAIGAILIPVVNMLVDVLGGVIEFLTGVFTGNWEQAWNGIIGIFEGIWNGLGDIFKGVLNGVIDLINGFLGSLNEVGNFVSDVTGGAISFEIGKIPHLADGATVLPRRGGTLAVLAEAGRAESVVDTGLLNRALEQGINGSGGSGVVITQNNELAHLPLEVSVEAAGQQLASMARRVRA
ncbi:tape measure protein [Microbacterium sp. NPDC078814]|uniref:tape measure protein n=1 Tax=Microbacterium sp. NPDC078814 TaxID=3154767 RepID=UPI0034507DA5